MWNSYETTIAGIAAGEMAPSVRALVLLLTAIALALGLILLGVMWVYYSRSPETFSIYNFWSYLKPWLTTTDHKEVGIMYFLYGFFFFLVGGLLSAVIQNYNSQCQRTLSLLRLNTTHSYPTRNYHDFPCSHANDCWFHELRSATTNWSQRLSIP